MPLKRQEWGRLTLARVQRGAQGYADADADSYTNGEIIEKKPERNSQPRAQSDTHSQVSS
jgi:hypothetical protein